MGNTNNSWHPFIWHCPNCSKKVIGYQDSEGFMKVECSKCHSIIVRKMMGRRHDRFDVYAPQDQTNDFGLDGIPVL